MIDKLKLGEQFRAAIKKNQKRANETALINFADNLEVSVLKLMDENVATTEKAAQTGCGANQEVSLHMTFPYEIKLSDVASQRAYKTIYNFCVEHNIDMTVHAPFDSKVRNITLHLAQKFQTPTQDRLPTFEGEAPSRPVQKNLNS